MDSISIEMVFRGIYHFTQALNQGSTTDIIAYLTAPENRDLGIVKSPRPKRTNRLLICQPNPLDNWLLSLNLSPMGNK